MLMEIWARRAGNVPHDWYKEKLESVRPLETGKCKSASSCLAKRLERQVRRDDRQASAWLLVSHALRKRMIKFQSCAERARQQRSNARS